MSRFDIGVVIVTFVALALGALIQGVVIPIARLKVARNRHGAGSSLSGVELRAEIQRLTGRNLELEQQMALFAQPAAASEHNSVTLKDAAQ